MPDSNKRVTQTLPRDNHRTFVYCRTEEGRFCEEYPGVRVARLDEVDPFTKIINQNVFQINRNIFYRVIKTSL